MSNVEQCTTLNAVRRSIYKYDIIETNKRRAWDRVGKKWRKEKERIARREGREKENKKGRTKREKGRTAR